MIKHRLCEEVVAFDGIEYKFTSNFRFMESLELKGVDPLAIWRIYEEGNLSPKNTLNVLACSLSHIDGDEVTTGHEESVVTLIEAAGMNQAAGMAQQILSHMLVGSVGVKLISMEATQTEIKEKTQSFLCKNSRKAGLLSVVVLGILGTLAWTTFSH